MKKISLIVAYLMIILSPQIIAQQISPMLFGQNAWMPDTVGDAYNCMEPPCILYGKLHQNWKKIQESKASVIRYGGIANDRNMSTGYQYIRIIDSVRARGMEPIIQVPFDNYRYSATQAASIVKYINITKGKNIKYWIIGNEPNLEYGYTTSAQVAAYIRPFSTAMKNMDPSIKIIGPDVAWYDAPILHGITTPGGPDDLTGRDANGRYYLDVISFHTYPFSGSQTRDQVKATLTSSTGFESNLKTLKARLQVANAFHDRSGEELLEMAVTEANINYRNSSTDDLSGNGAMSFIGGQFCTEFYGLAMKHGVKMVNFWSVVEGNSVSLNIGYIDKFTGRPQPSYQHFRMMANNFKGEYVQSASSNSDVKVFASGYTDGGGSVIIMNQSYNQLGFGLGLNNESIADSDEVSINVAAGIVSDFHGNIPGEATVVLVYNASGVIVKRIKYYKNGHADGGLFPEEMNMDLGLPVVNSSSDSIIDGQTLTLSTTAVSNGTYSWKKDGIAIDNSNSSSITINESGDYVVSATSGSITAHSVSKRISEADISALEIIPSGTLSVCSGVNTFLNTVGDSVGAYQWYFNNEPIADATALKCKANLSGSYQVKRIIAGLESSSNVTTVNKVILPRPVIIARELTTFCMGGSVTLNAGDVAEGVSIQWLKNYRPIKGANSPTFIAKYAGNYRVQVSSGDCKKVSDYITVTTLQRFVPYVVQSGDTLKAKEYTQMKYEWRRDGHAIEGATGTYYIPTQNGKYRLVLNNGTCNSYSAIFEIIIDKGITEVVSITKDTLDAFADVEKKTVKEEVIEEDAVQDLGGDADSLMTKDIGFNSDELKIQIGPVPSNNDFHLFVKTDSPLEVTMRISDLQGRVFSEPIKINDGFHVFGEDLPAGSYFVLVQQGGSKKLLRIVKIE